MSTAVHEASHVAAAIMLGRVVDHVWVEVGHTLPGETLGQARIPVGERIEASQIPVRVVGYMSENEPGWPPSFEDARDEKLEALGKVVGFLGICEETYDQLVGIAHDMLADPDFIRLRNCLARALAVVPRLEREDVETLCQVHGFPIPERKEQPCST